MFFLFSVYDMKPQYVCFCVSSSSIWKWRPCCSPPPTSDTLLPLQRCFTSARLSPRYTQSSVCLCCRSCIDCSCPLSGFRHLSFCLNPALVLSCFLPIQHFIIPVCLSLICVSSVSSEIITGRDIRFGAVLSGSGVRLFFKALSAWTRQLPGWNAASGRAGQDIARYVDISHVCHACYRWQHLEGETQ